MIEKEFQSKRFTHLLGDQSIDLDAMIFVIGQAFVNLSLGENRKTAQDIFDRRSIDEQSDDIVNTNARALDDGSTSANPR